MKISVHFTMKGQELSHIEPVLEALAQKHKDATLIHGHLTREGVVKLGYSTDLVDMLDRYFPHQENYYMQREEMVEYIASEKATAYVIGAVVDGVKIEADLLEGKGCKVEYLSLIKLD